MTQILGIGFRHDKNTGCVNDLWMDKRGVDIGMRAGFLCQDCKEATNLYDESISIYFPDIEAILDAVSSASRYHNDILMLSFGSDKISKTEWDIFICHNSEDKDDIQKINSLLKSKGISTWLDEERISPGVLWQPELEKIIPSINCVAVFVGESGVGPWQNAETRAFLTEFINRGCPVIPVILKSAKAIPDLPLFLKQFMWVDMRRDFDASISKLASAVFSFRHRIHESTNLCIHEDTRKLTAVMHAVEMR